MNSVPASNPLQALQTGSGYHFSAPGINDLGAENFTLVGIANDCSTSVESYKPEMVDCLKKIVESCQKSPRSENLMLRLSQFANDVSELHGFRELVTIKPDEYDGILRVGGRTALNDGVYESIETISEYAKKMAASEFLANGICFVVTDGAGTHSKHSTKAVKDLVARIKREETLESIQIVLVGITGGNTTLARMLSDFQQEVGITKYININDASPKELAKLAEWVSQSISSTSTALGTGQPSQLLPLSF